MLITDKINMTVDPKSLLVHVTTAEIYDVY